MLLSFLIIDQRSLLTLRDIGYEYTQMSATMSMESRNLLEGLHISVLWSYIPYEERRNDTSEDKKLCYILPLWYSRVFREVMKYTSNLLARNLSHRQHLPISQKMIKTRAKLFFACCGYVKKSELFEAENTFLYVFQNLRSYEN